VRIIQTFKYAQLQELEIKNLISNAIGKRFLQIKANLPKKRGDINGDYWYSGRADNPEYVTRKVVEQMLNNGIQLSEDVVQRVLNGEFDSQIKEGFNMAAGAEWWYNSGQGKEYN